MNREEFIEELKKSDNPEKNLKVYNRFVEYQSVVVETLNEFHRVCEENGINYQVSCGSLLGAIRDGGQIPWDYDSDVFVPYEEKDKLIEILKTKLSDNFYFYCPEINNKCRHLFIRVAKKGYRTEVIHVDVFFLVGLPEDEKEKQEMKRRIIEIGDRRYDKLVKLHDEIRSIRTNVEKVINKFKTINCNPDEEFKIYDEICRKYPVSKSKRCSTADTFINDYEFDSKDILETMLYKTDLGEFRVPVKYEEILNGIYKDYKKIFPLKDRIEEYSRNCIVLDHYAKIK